jgi:hypothetical protein
VPTDLFAFVLNEPEPNSTCRTVRALNRTCAVVRLHLHAHLCLSSPTYATCRIVPFSDQGGAVARRRVRRSPRRALALGRPRPARPRRPSHAEVPLTWAAHSS